MARPLPLQSAWVYGPVDSRRLGRSLGVNVLPVERKVCSMDCAYCQYGSSRGPPSRGPGGDACASLPAPEEVLDAAEVALRALAGRAKRAHEGAPLSCDAITLAGNGEPTLHPRLGTIADGLARLRDRFAPGVPLVLLTNGTRLGSARVRRAIASIDRPIVKLDAGDETTFRDVDRPRSSRVTLERVAGWLSELPRGEVQALFVEGPVTNARAPQVAAWLDLVARLRPRAVQVTTIDRGTTVPGLTPLPAAWLEDVAARARARGVKAQAWACRDASRFAPGDGARAP